MLGEGPVDEGVLKVGGEWALGGVAEAVAYCFNRASHLANLSCKSWFGLLLLRAGAGVEGVHVTFALMQLEQGVFRSHLILRCWQRTQARTLWLLLWFGLVLIGRAEAE